MSPSWHPDGMVELLYQWVPPRDVVVSEECLAVGAAGGISERMVRLLAARGVSGAEELRLFLADPEAGLHDPRLVRTRIVFIRMQTLHLVGCLRS